MERILTVNVECKFLSVKLNQIDVEKYELLKKESLSEKERIKKYLTELKENFLLNEGRGKVLSKFCVEKEDFFIFAFDEGEICGGEIEVNESFDATVTLEEFVKLVDLGFTVRVLSSRRKI